MVAHQQELHALEENQGGDRKSYTAYCVYLSSRDVNRRFCTFFGPTCARAGVGGFNLHREHGNTVFPTVQRF